MGGKPRWRMEADVKSFLVFKGLGMDSGLDLESI